MIQGEAGAWDDGYRTARSVRDPEHRFEAIFQLGEAQVQAGKRDLARQTFRKLLEANAGPTPLTTDEHSIARAQIYAGDLKAALATTERMDTFHWDLLTEVATAQAEAGDYSGARTTIAERISDDAEKSRAYAAVAYGQAKAGHAKDALRWAESLDHRLHRGNALMSVAIAVAERRGVALSAVEAGAGPAVAGGNGAAKDQAQQAKPAADQPAKIEGKTVEEWQAALKDRDPAVRERAVEVLGERTLDPTAPQNEKIDDRSRN